MKMLIENNGYQLFYFPQAVNRYAVYKNINASPSGELKFNQMICRSPIFSKKLKSYFTFSQIQDAVAKIHALKYCAKKFK